MTGQRAALVVVALVALIAARGADAQSNTRQVPASSAANPHGVLQESCSMCHRADGWKPAQISKEFRHAPKTFALDGAHATTTCMSCHRRLDFKETDKTCASCHRDVHNGELGADCSRCHTTRSFVDRPAMERAHERTRFPLRGAHAAASCEACHTPSASGSMRFVNRSASCVGCHATAYVATRSPDHQAAGFSRECTSCHTIVTWVGARFDHSQTAFALTGAHSTATCAGCHGDGTYRGKSAQCATCHQDDYDRAAKPAHTGFPATCADCHVTADWKGAVFDHQVTRFPLTGAHQATTCAGCHQDGVYRGKSLECSSCHQSDFDRATAPPHTGVFSRTCTTCHNTARWLGATFDHAATRFALTGAHLAATCRDCHSDGVYAGRSPECFSCHRVAYERTATPPHAAAGFGTTCSTCHTTTRWPGAAYDHSTTRFPLTGAHIPVSCAGCHGDGVYVGKNLDCYSCHRGKYDQAVNPPHVAAGFPTTCATCHNTTSWPGAVFDHAVTRFALTGAHRAVPCSACHADGVYRDKATDCYACHRPVYEATRNPPHAAAGFGLTCTACHTTTAWTGAVFNHSTTRFPLTGAHTTTACAGCHGDGVYRGKSTDCYSCHRTDYTGTTAPNHGAAGFPTTCSSCHTTTTWLGATFNHDGSWFPIYSGKHRGRWSTCGQCHPSPTDFRQFTCLTCHEHNQTKMDDTHKEKAGYRYDSIQCYACHPRP